MLFEELNMSTQQIEDNCNFLLIEVRAIHDSEKLSQRMSEIFPWPDLLLESHQPQQATAHVGMLPLHYLEGMRARVEMLVAILINVQGLVSEAGVKVV